MKKLEEAIEALCLGLYEETGVPGVEVRCKEKCLATADWILEEARSMSFVENGERILFFHNLGYLLGAHKKAPPNEN